LNDGPTGFLDKGFISELLRKLEKIGYVCGEFSYKHCNWPVGYFS
jgi:hypothetical protein